MLCVFISAGFPKGLKVDLEPDEGGKFEFILA